MGPRKSTFVLLILFILGAAGISLTHTPIDRTLKLDERFLVPPKGIERFVLGFRGPAADGLWIRVIQDFDFCEKSKNQPRAAVNQQGLTAKKTNNGDNSDNSDNSDNKVAETKNDRQITVEDLVGQGLDPLAAILQATAAPKLCERGWVYKMLDRITDIDPRFDIVYRFGATMLSVVISDIEGARLIFEKGLMLFPKDWTLAYRAAYHYLYELKDFKRASELLALSGQNGAPLWVFSLSAKLMTKVGQTEAARDFLSDFIHNNSDERWTEYLQKRLEELDKILLEQKKKKDKD